MAIPREAYKALQSIVGPEYVSDDPGICECYRRGGYGKHRPALEGKAVRPGAVILPANTSEVRGILKVCYRYGIPFIPVGTFMISFQAPKISDALTVDLKRMDHFEIDEKNMYATVGPGIIYAQLQAEAMKRGMLTSVPGCGAAATVIGNSLNAGMGPLQYRYGWANHRTLAVEWVLPDGELVELGSAALSDDYFWGEGLGPDLRGILRGLFGWQGGMGIVTKMATKLFPFPTEALERIGVSPRTFFELSPDRIRWINVFYDDPAKAIEAAREVSRAEVGASVMTAPFVWRYISRAESREDFWKLWNRDIAKLRETTPHMMRVMVVGYASEKQTAYEERVVSDIIAKLGGDIRPGRNVDESWFNNADAIRIYFPAGAEISLNWTFDALSTCYRLGVLTAELKEEHTPPFTPDYGIPGWFQSGEMGHFGFGEMLLYWNPLWSQEDNREVEGALVEAARRDIKNDLYCCLMNSYGPDMDIVGPAYHNYHEMMLKLKEVFDPKNLSNPPRPLDYGRTMD